VHFYTSAHNLKLVNLRCYYNLIKYGTACGFSTKAQAQLANFTQKSVRGTVVEVHQRVGLIRVRVRVRVMVRVS